MFEIVVGYLRDPLPEKNMYKGMFPEYEKLFEAAFKVLWRGAQGTETETDAYISHYYKVFLQHVLYLKTESACELVVELVQDSREIIDDLLAGTSSGVHWMLNHVDVKEQQRGDQIIDTVDADFYRILTELCVCQGLAVRRAQGPRPGKGRRGIEMGKG